MRGLIVRKTRASLSQTAIVTYENKVLLDGWLGDIIRFRTQEQQYEYCNGSIIAIGGMDKASKVMSSEWDMIYVMEATELLEEDWEALTTRLRNGVMPYQQLLADCNPSAPTHWLKRRCDRGATLMLESRHEDNPSVTDAYLATLDALTGVRYRRLRLGQWAAAEGMVYEQWDRATHIATREQLVRWGLMYADGTLNRWTIRGAIASVDWGWTNPGVIQIWLIDGDGRMYLFRELYRTMRTIEWWIQQAQSLMQEFSLAGVPISVFVCDPSEPAYISQFEGAGIPAIGATNAISPGINVMQARLKVAGDGRPRMYIYEYSLQERDEQRDEKHEPVCFEQEIDGYVWPQAKDGQPVKEVPVKHNDHAMDASRYACMYLDEDDRYRLSSQESQAISSYVAGYK
jgi:phage terminase large subunit